MDEIANIVCKKLESFNLPKLESLNIKTKERIFETEAFIQNAKISIENSLSLVKATMLTKSNLSNSKNTHFSRKTIYNDTILNEYIDKSIAIQPDYFNFNKIDHLQKDLDALNTLYQNMLFNIIDIQNFKFEIEELKKEISFNQEEIERLHIVINEKNKTIALLKSNSKSTNISILPFKE